MRKEISSFLIATSGENSGKTIFTLGLIQALKKRGLDVQPFKCGPDYIDTIHLSYVAGKPSYNLDTWMASENHVQSVYLNKSLEADVAVVDGVMSLFDGAVNDDESSLALASLLDLPVVLIVDASSISYSITPLLYRFRNFEKEVKIAGIVFNQVAGEKHYNSLKKAAYDSGIEPLGYLPLDEKLEIGSRHLGLYFPGKGKEKQAIETATAHIEKNVLVDKMLKNSKSLFKPDGGIFSCEIKKKIAVAKDNAFNFIYQATIDTLEEYGVITYFSPLYDKKLPEADLVWLPGGYTEFYLNELAANRGMIQQIADHVKKGKALVAECGGMIYMGRSVTDSNGEEKEMTGIFSYETSFQQKQLQIGYREFKKENFVFRGYEFHYSELSGKDYGQKEIEVFNTRKVKVNMPIFRYKNCWSSYMRLYLGESQKMQKFLKNIQVL